MLATRSIAITGATGFLGWHLRARLRLLHSGIEVRLIDRDDFVDRDKLAAAIDSVDVVVQLAGANRGPDDFVADTNISLARCLVDALDTVGGRPFAVYANTVHADRDTGYGRSKRQAGLILRDWGRRSGAGVADLELPNLFGEGGRPHYNSAVATFCHELALGRPSEVRGDGRTELMYVQDACTLLLAAAHSRADGACRVPGQALSVSEVYDRLRKLRHEYHGVALPVLRDDLDLRLFNTLRTAMFPEHCPVRLEPRRDHRGTFTELARGAGESQISFSVTRAGLTRGDHVHLDKIERFVVVGGRAQIRLRRLFSEAVHEFTVSGDEPVAIDMPTFYAHSLSNCGDDDLLAVFWSNDHFRPEAPDTHSEPVSLSSEPVSA